jgi:hypothetical protein
LHPKARSDRGVPRVLTPEQERHILEQVKAHPAIAVKVLYRQWKEQDPKLPAISAVYRALQRQSLGQRSRRYLVRQAISGPTKAFEAPWVNELWMVDFSPGPFLHLPDQKKALATQLCAILDDHSRVVAHAAYGLRRRLGSHLNIVLFIDRKPEGPKSSVRCRGAETPFRIVQYLDVTPMVPALFRCDPDGTRLSE